METSSSATQSVPIETSGKIFSLKTLMLDHPDNYISYIFSLDRLVDIERFRIEAYSLKNWRYEMIITSLKVANEILRPVENSVENIKQLVIASKLEEASLRLSEIEFKFNNLQRKFVRMDKKRNALKKKYDNFRKFIKMYMTNFHHFSDEVKKLGLERRRLFLVGLLENASNCYMNKEEPFMGFLKTFLDNVDEIVRWKKDIEQIKQLLKSYKICLAFTK